MIRNNSGQILLDSKDIPLSPTSKSLEDPEISLTGISIKETSIDEDGVLKEVGKDLDGRNDRRRKLKSVLKSTGSTPVIDESRSTINTDDDYELSKTNSQRNKRPMSPPGRECCTIL